MSNLTQFAGGARKSIQRGVISMASGAASGSATISAVTTSKAELRFTGSSGTDPVRIELASATTITATRAAATQAGSAGWELTEYY